MKAGELLQNTAALDTAMQDLHRSVIQVVRPSTSEVDRRRYRRRPCLIEATLTHQGKSHGAILHDISERGCHVITALRCPASERIDIALTRFGIRLAGTVAEPSDDGMHIHFVGDGLKAEEVDRASQTTVIELVRLAKSDHVAFVKRVVDAVAGGEAVSSASLPTPHHCRFGRWHDNISDRASMGLPAFKAVKPPHEAVHEFGRKALVAFEANDAAAAQRCIAEMRTQSEEVMRQLDAFAQEISSTFGNEIGA